ncbi:hypothetical protein PV332_10615 [Streptomyces scabiei]|uniref:hypothetical protein n=1 Tax=Streptomyces scabiei TaxID=1930 RepID=UPI00299F9AC9|nr:hypothetical protein [Streptomyces scabiei]MDX2575933.1 hypothetical protein [Streptomyces scabiei]MDX2794040.1 hypothetical protein [Streptomyces scabiei]MDX2885594.1 hypothetical protein [Streptomyces scabiei]MDX2993453.1 hypothetical protein [Streptomyces scabiei]MDX3028433.1 hypothetical protein [Streptomyces scabiei]
MKDSFGTSIDVGDYVLSAASSSGFFKLGVVYAAPSGRLMMEVTRSNWDRAQRRSEVGSNVLVLRKVDGTVPEYVGVTPPSVADVESTLRCFLAELDYDLHKYHERDEETGEDHYPASAEWFHSSIMKTGEAAT